MVSYIFNTMGCGKQVSSRSSNIVIVSSQLERSQDHTAHLANPIEIKNEIILVENVEAVDELGQGMFFRKESPKGSNNECRARDSLFEVSKISHVDDGMRGKLNSIGNRSPTEVLKRIEDGRLDSQINFDFLNETSKVKKNGLKDEESLDIEVLIN